MKSILVGIVLGLSFSFTSSAGEVSNLYGRSAKFVFNMIKENFKTDCADVKCDVGVFNLTCNTVPAYGASCSGLVENGGGVKAIVGQAAVSMMENFEKLGYSPSCTGGTRVNACILNLNEVLCHRTGNVLFKSYECVVNW